MGNEAIGIIGFTLALFFGIAYVVSTLGVSSADASERVEKTNVLLDTGGKVQVPTVTNPVKQVYVEPAPKKIAPYIHETSGLLNYDDTVNIEQYRKDEPTPISQPPTIIVKEDVNKGYVDAWILRQASESDSQKQGATVQTIEVTTTGKIAVDKVMPTIVGPTGGQIRGKYVVL
jgi:hypothetical protein